MTKGEVLKQVYDLSVGGNFNHETGWSFLKFKSYVAKKFNSKKTTIYYHGDQASRWMVGAENHENQGRIVGLFHS